MRNLIDGWDGHVRFFIYFLFLSDEGPMLKTLDHTIRIGSTPTFLYFDLYLHSAYAAHYDYCHIWLSYGIFNILGYLQPFDSILCLGLNVVMCGNLREQKIVVGS